MNGNQSGEFACEYFKGLKRNELYISNHVEHFVIFSYNIQQSCFTIYIEPGCFKCVLTLLLFQKTVTHTPLGLELAEHSENHRFENETGFD